MKNAVKYGRVSSDRQEKEGFSLPAQEKLLNDYAAKQNLKIVASFFEAETAKRAGRKQFSEMVKFLKKNKSVRTILVEKTDRLYRNFKDYVLLDEFEDLEIHFVKEGTVLSKNSRSQDKFMHGIRVLMAKNYIDNLSEEIKKGLKEKAEQGYCPTKAPFGYKNIIRKDKRRVIVPDEETAPFIVKAFELYSTGIFTYKGIAKILTEEGFKPNGKPCTKRTIELILHNYFYVGQFEYGGKRYEHGQHKAIVEPELFFAVQKRLNEQFVSRPRTHKFPFLGLIKCAHCGCSITAEIQKGKYIYYHCTGKRGGDCKKKFIRQEKIEAALLEFLKQIVLTEEEIAEIKLAAKEMLQQKAEFTELASETLNKEINKLRRRLDNLYTDRADGLIDEEFYCQKRQQWQSELDAALIKYETSVRFDRTFIDDISRLLELSKNAYNAYLKESDEERLKLLKILGSNFFFDGENIIVEAFEPFDIIIKRQNLKKLESACPSSNLFFEKLFAAVTNSNNIALFENLKLCKYAA